MMKSVQFISLVPRSSGIWVWERDYRLLKMDEIEVEPGGVDEGIFVSSPNRMLVRG